MLSKTCFKCGKNSYSASSYGEWICPVCGEDLSGVKVNK